jgi:periplasmic divalent cation tolerance protein
MKYIVVFITTSSQAEAERIADSLIGSKLAACVNIIPKIKSIYTWKGKKETSKESLMIIKTRQNLFKKLKEAVKKLHSYEVCEIISLPIEEGNEDYLKWINLQTF